jgi:iron(III) transport system ATP-binding protein
VTREEVVLRLENLNKYYPPTGDLGRGAVLAPALSDVSLDIGRGEFFTLLGPSGCGKTTTLQCIAGLEHPGTGRITMGDRAVFDSDANILVPPNKRGLGMVFQSYAIWPHMTVYENVAFPLQHGGHRLPAYQVRSKVLAALDRVMLGDFVDRPAPYLSGGQQQRVALARALVSEPSIILLDEPLSNLDAKLRDAMRVELRDLVKSLGITTIYVTHDQTEALSMSDRIALMNKGRVVQLGTPEDLYLRPKSAFVAEFVGRSNIISGKVEKVGSDRRGVVATGFGPLACVLPDGAQPGQTAELMVRPHGVEILAAGATGGNVFAARVGRSSFLGEFFDIELVAADGSLVRVFGSPYERHEAGSEVSFRLPEDRCLVLACRS